MIISINSLHIYYMYEQYTEYCKYTCTVYTLIEATVLNYVR